jgi:hypothetical protein
MGKMNVRVEFEGEILQRLDCLKAYYGVENYTDLIRILVNDKHRQLFPKEATA